MMILHTIEEAEKELRVEIEEVVYGGDIGSIKDLYKLLDTGHMTDYRGDDRHLARGGVEDEKPIPICEHNYDKDALYVCPLGALNQDSAEYPFPPYADALTVAFDNGLISAEWIKNIVKGYLEKENV